MVIPAVSNKTEDLLKHFAKLQFISKSILKHPIKVFVYNFSQSFGAADCKMKQQLLSDKRSDIVIRLRTACEGNLNANSSSPAVIVWGGRWEILSSPRGRWGGAITQFAGVWIDSDSRAIIRELVCGMADRKDVIRVGGKLKLQEVISFHVFSSRFRFGNSDGGGCAMCTLSCP